MQLSVPQQVKQGLTMWPNSSTQSYAHSRLKATIQKGLVHSVHSNSSQARKCTHSGCPPTDAWINKTCDCIQWMWFSHKDGLHITWITSQYSCHTEQSKMGSLPEMSRPKTLAVAYKTCRRGSHGFPGISPAYHGRDTACLPPATQSPGLEYETELCLQVPPLPSAWIMSLAQEFMNTVRIPTASNQQ